MIRINAIPNTAAAKSYFSQADYYIDGQDHEAQWHGKGAEMLGLSGPISEAAFERLCENKHPQTGKQLTAKHMDNRRIGYDFTFSPSKSVSILYALGADPRLADEFRSAVAETMAEMEREMATRVRKGGQDTDRRTGNMIWADFLHHTSRPINGVPDPQLHVHAVVFNATFDHEENQWKAGQFGDLKKNAPYFQAAFRARLANRLQALGYEVRRSRDDFEIVGVPQRVIKEFSRRTDLIEKTADKLGVKRPESKAKLGATTREKKTDGLTWDDLLTLWKDRLKPGELEALQAIVKAADMPLAMEDRSRESVDWALRHLLERSSVVPQRQVMLEALKHGLGSVTVDGVLEEIGKRKDLIRRVVGGIEMVTTQAVLDEENRIIAFAKEGRGRWRPMGVDAHGRGTNSVVSQNSVDVIDKLSPTQSSAVKHALSSRDRLIMIRGAAGSGKTTLTKAILAGVDVPYVVLAPSAEASRGVLRRENVDPNADTLAKFLNDEEMQSRVKGGLIVLDEASLAGAHDLARLVKSAEQLKARLILLGDRRQHKSVARGDVLALLEDKAGVKVATVGEIRRQTGEYRTAVKDASDGKVIEAFHRLDKLGWIKEGHESLVTDYLAGLKANKSQLVIAPTHAEGDTVTHRLRERLKQGGRWIRDKNGNLKETAVIHGPEKEIETLASVNLTEAQRTDPETLRTLEGAQAQFVRHSKTARSGSRIEITAENAADLAKEGSRFVVYKPEKTALAAGDTIRITANAKDITGTHKLNNGAVYQVAGFTDQGVKLSNGWVVDTPHLAHGLVSTSHAAQGRTTDRVLIAMGEQSLPAIDTATAYVAMSRGRQAAFVYADDRQALLDAASRERPRMLASELVRAPKNNIAKKRKRALAAIRELVDRFRQPERGVRKERGREM